MAIRDPFTVIVRVSEGSDLGATMAGLRTWLDQEKIQTAEFKSSVDGAGHRLTLGFRTIEDAERLRAQFGQGTLVRSGRPSGVLERALARFATFNVIAIASGLDELALLF
jgi:hypothetical protein